MWDEDDTFGRWVQGLCAIPLLAWTYFAFDLVASGYDRDYSYGSYGRRGAGFTGIVTAYLAYRCLRYAVTGRNNINRDDYD